MVILIGTETEWSISPSERGYKGKAKISDEFEEGQRVVIDLPEFIGIASISLNNINESFLRLCSTRSVYNNERLSSFTANSNCYTENGFRIYRDSVGHLESCTPECKSIFDVIGYEKASEVFLLAALRKYEKEYLGDESFFILLKNNTDGKRCWGAHESYGIPKSISEERLDTLIPFLVTRIIYAGCGYMRRYPNDSSRNSSIDDYFELSPRATFIKRIRSNSASESERAVLQQKDDPLMDANLYKRVHISCGDPSMFPYTNALKLGTTKIVLELLEEDKKFKVPRLNINASEAIKQVSLYPSLTLDFEDNQRLTPLEVQKKFYLEPALKIFKGKNQETDWILDNWAFVLNKLNGSNKEIPKKLIGYLDCPTKRYLLSIFSDFNKLDLSHKKDLEQLVWKGNQFHDVDPGSGLLYPYGRESYYPTNPDKVLYMIFNPPFNTRAGIRGTSVKNFSKNLSLINWEGIKFKIDGTELSDGEVDLNNLLCIDGDELKQLYQNAPSSDSFIEFCKKFRIWEIESYYRGQVKVPEPEQFPG